MDNVGIGFGGNRLATLAADAKAAHEEICRMSPYSAERMVDAGRALSEAKTACDEHDVPLIPRGQWAHWVEDVADIPRATADRYIQIFRAIEQQLLTIAVVADAGQIGALKEIKREILRREQGDIEYGLPAIPEGKFRTIVIDPPWDMQKIERDVRPNQVGFDYPTMTEEELAAWHVLVDKAADDCHLFMWTTHKFLPAALRLVEGWDFKYVFIMVWHKPGGFQPIGLAQYNCEFVVYAHRGDPVFIDTTDFNCCFNAPRREHSRKPDEFYDTIKRVTPGPRLDMFARGPHEGFAVHGNEIERFAA
jgi:N6-adenosine-specific RNA methylase IME4